MKFSRNIYKLKQTNGGSIWSDTKECIELTEVAVVTRYHYIIAQHNGRYYISARNVPKSLTDRACYDMEEILSDSNTIHSRSFLNELKEELRNWKVEQVVDKTNI